MRRALITALAGAAVAAATPAFATNPHGNPHTPTSNPPTLHGFCSLASPCPDLGSNSPTAVNPPVFGLATSGQQATGTVLIDILVPDNIANPSSLSFTLSSFTSGGILGASTFTASLFDANGAAPGTPAWTLGQLDAYLGLPQGPPPAVSPSNSIGAFITTPSYNGFYVYQANIGNVTLPGTSGVGAAGQDAFLIQVGQSLVPGSYILGFITQDGGHHYGATANSGAILETGQPLPEPTTWAMMLLGFGAAGVSIRRSRRKGLLRQIA